MWELKSRAETSTYMVFLWMWETLVLIIHTSLLQNSYSYGQIQEDVKIQAMVRTLNPNTGEAETGRNL